MAKCIECGAEIANGQILCEHCANSQNGTSELEGTYLDDFSLSEEELNDFDINNIEDIDLGDLGDISIINDDIEEIPMQGNLDNLDMTELNDFDNDLEIKMPSLDEMDSDLGIEMPSLDEMDNNLGIEMPVPNEMDDNLVLEMPSLDEMDNNLGMEMPVPNEMDNSLGMETPVLDETDNLIQEDLSASKNVTDVELTEMPFFDDEDEDDMEMLLKDFSTQPDNALDSDLGNSLGGLDNLDVMQKEPTLVEMGLPIDDDEDDSEVDDLLSFLSEDMEVGGSSKSANDSPFSLDNLMEMEEENALISDSMHSQNQSNTTDEDAFESDLTDIINATSSEEKPKKPSLMDKLFGNIHDAKSKREHEKMLSAEEKKELRKKEKAEKKAAEKAKKEDPAYKAEQEAKKREQEEKKAQAKAVKEAKKKEKEEKKKQRKAELEAQWEAEAKEDQGRINPIGATIVFICFGAFAAFVIFGTSNFSYNQSVAKAKEYFGSRYYTEAYNEVRGVELKDEDIETYDKIITVMYVNKQWNSYNNYYAMQKYPEALDSLLKGLQKYDEHITEGEQLGVVNDLDYVRGQITKELKKEFSMSEKKAYSIINSSTQEEYSQKVMEASKVAE